MRQDGAVVDPADDDKRTRILDGAFVKFAAYGLARTSMADIAEAAAMSRPAVYQYFSNKDEIYAAVLARILEAAAERALEALSTPGELVEQLDGFLQRWYGDLQEQMTKTLHGQDVVEAKAGHAKPVADAVNARIRKAVTERLGAAGGRGGRELVDVVLLAPMGYKYDAPSLAVFRKRLTVLARLVADAVTATS
jgi:AcrR family transcriptional regulator